MANCDLTIELDDPNRRYVGGEAVSGHVLVTVDGRIACKGLTVKTIWETHGRGNVDKGVGESKSVFAGEWIAGNTYRYPFQLSSAQWPSTYHGHHLNVDHFVFAQADVRWKTDPKVRTPFQVQGVPPDPAELLKSAKPSAARKAATGWIGGVILTVIVVFFLTMMALNPFTWVVAGLAGMWWFIFKWLPAWKMGRVEFQVDDLARTGDTLRGLLTVTPRREVALNRIVVKIKATEACTRGSGTNKTTHRHTLVEQQHVLGSESRLAPGTQHKFEFSHPIEPDAPVSLDLGSNQLVWSADVRVDIPRWPDWKKQLICRVLPGADAPPELARQGESFADGASSAKARDGGDPQSVDVADEPPEWTTEVIAVGNDDDPEAAYRDGYMGERESTVGGRLGFAETVQMIEKVRHSFDQLDRLIRGLAGIDLNVVAQVQRRSSVGSDGHFSNDPDSTIYAAVHPVPYLPLALSVPRSRQRELDSRIGQQWSGVGQIVGYDRRTGTLQIRLSE